MPKCEPVGLDFIDRAAVVARAEVVVESNPAQVWEVLNDTEGWPAWFEGMRKAEVTSPSWDGIGSTRRVSIGPMSVHERIVVWEPEQHWGFTALEISATAWVAKRLLETVEITSEGEGSRLVYTGALDPTPLSKPLARRLEKQLADAWRTSLRNIDRVTGTASHSRGRIERDYDVIRDAEFHDTPDLGQDTGATVGGVVITGTPPRSCGVTAAPVMVGDDPGNTSGWFAGADQAMPMPQVVLDLSDGVRSFGVSFLHWTGAGVDATDRARLCVYDEPGGRGQRLGQAVSSGGDGVIDYVAVVLRNPKIRSAVIDSPTDRTYCVTGYSVLR